MPRRIRPVSPLDVPRTRILGTARKNGGAKSIPGFGLLPVVAPSVSGVGIAHAPTHRMFASGTLTLPAVNAVFLANIRHRRTGSGVLTNPKVGVAGTAIPSTAATLSAANVSTVTSNTATIGVTTNKLGVLYVVISLTSTIPSIAQIKAGQTSAGTAATYASSQVITTAGAKTFSATGLSSTMPYFVFFLQATNTFNSNIPAAVPFTTPGSFIVPDLSTIFTQGTAKNHDLSQYYTLPSGETYTSLTQIAGTALSTIGVTLDSAGQQLVYNGSSPVASVTGVRFRLTTTPIVVGGTAENDWIARSNAPGVIWAYDFRNPLDVTKFRRYSSAGPLGGYDPNGEVSISQFIRKITSDGIGANQWCMELMHHDSSCDSIMWWHPFSPSPGQLGQIRAYPNTRNGAPINVFPDPPPQSDAHQWSLGNVAHPSFDNVGPIKDQNEIYVSYRVKLDPRLASWAPQSSGKVSYFDHDRGTTCECNFQLNTPSPYHFELYTGFGPTISGTNNAGADGFPAGEYSNFAGNSPPNLNFRYGEWMTFKFHLKPGTEHDDYVGGGPGDTLIEAFVQYQGDTAWRQWFKRSNLRWDWANTDGLQAGWNMLKLSMYYQGFPMPTDCFFHFTEVICSRSDIALPALTS